MKVEQQIRQANDLSGEKKNARNRRQVENHIFIECKNLGYLRYKFMNCIHVLLKDCWDVGKKFKLLALMVLLSLAGNASLMAQCPNPGLTVAGTDISCFGADDGMISIIVDDPNGYAGQYTYSIIGLPAVGVPIFRAFSTNNVSHTFTNLPPANYVFISVAIDDDATCTTLSGTPTNIIEPALLQLSATVTADCNLTGGGSIDLNVIGGTGPMVRFTWTGGLPDQEDHTGTVAAGTYDVEVEDSRGCTQTLTGIVVPGPSDATITGAGPFCVNDASINLTAATPGGTWSGAGITDAVNGTFDPATAGAGTHVITYEITDGNGCLSSDTENVTVNALPDATINPVAPVCVDAAAFNLTAATLGGTWGGTGITDAVNGTFDPATAGAGTHTISYTVTDGNGCTNTDTEDITVNALPDATITPPGPLCINNAAINLVAATTGGTWSGTGITDAVNGTFDPATAGIGTHTITYNITDGNGCANSDTENIVVNALPDATINPEAPFCLNDAATNLSAATPGGTWSGTGITDAVNGTFDPAVAGAGTHTITYTVTDGNGCTNNDTEDFTVNPLPDATINPMAPVCIDAAAFNLTAATPGGTWAGTGITDAVNGTFDPAVAGVGTHTITYTVTDGNGCTNIDTEDIVVNPLPDATITAGGPFCLNDAATNLTAATPGGTWSGTGITDAVNGTFDPAVAGIGTFTITYNVTDGNGCTNSDTEDFTVNPLPDATINAVAPVCANAAAFNLTAATGGGTWSGTGITDAVNGTFDPAVAGAGTHTITYAVTDGNGCTNTDTEDILVNPLPDATINAVAPVCVNAVAFNLTAATPGGTWAGTGITDAINGTFDPAVAGIGTHTITYIVTDGNGCTNNDTEDVEVTPLPDATITAGGPFCIDDAAVNLVAATPGGTWSGTGITDAVNGTFDPAVAGAGTFTITYSITDGGGCTDSDTEDFTVNALPDATITAVAPVCVNGVAFNLTAATAGGTWSGTGITDAVNGTFDPAVAGIGTHTITYNVTDGNGCSNTDTETVEVTALPDATINAVAPVCVDAVAFNLTAATAGGTWSGTGITDAINGTFDPAVAGLGTHTITYNVTDGAGCVNSDTENIIVNPLPDATITAVAPVCVDAIAFNLSAATPGGNWSGTGITDAINGTFDPTVAGAGTHTITYNVTDGNGCTNTDTEDIVVNPLPDASITPAGPLCINGAPINLTAATLGGTWSGTGITDAVNGTFDPAIAGAGTHTITYNVTDGNGCSNTDTEDIVVNNLPDPGLDATIDVCKSDNAVNLFAALGGTPQAGGTWNDDDGTGGLTGDMFDATVAGATAGGTFNFTYTANTGGCAAATATVTVNVIAEPNSGTGSNGTACVTTTNFDLFTLLAGFDAGGTWNDDDLTLALSGANNEIFDASAVAPNTYSFTYIVTSPTCPATATTVNVTVVNNLNAGTAVANVQVCSDQTAFDLFNGLTGNDAGGTWSDDNLTGAVTGNLFDASAVVPGNYMFTYTISAPGCTSDTEQISVEVIAAPTAIAGLDQRICFDNTALAATAVGVGETGTWIPLNGAPTPDNINDPNSTVTNLNPGLNEFMWSVSNGLCTVTDVVEVDFVNIQQAVVGLDRTICESFVNLSGNAVNPAFEQGIWSYTGGVIPAPIFDPNPPTSENVLVTGLLPGETYQFTWTISDQNPFGCASTSATVTITVEDEMVLDMSGTDISTCGGNDGEVSVNVLVGGVPGTGTYSFAWTDPIGNPIATNSATLSNLTLAGTYTVTVTDTGLGCSVTNDVTITEPVNFTLGIAGNNISTCGGNDGDATLTVTGGSGDFTFAWTGPNGFTANTQNINGLSDAGNYSVVVTDNISGCVDNIAINITEPVNFTLGIAGNNISTCGGNDGAATLTVTGGSGDFTFIWSGPNGFTANTQNINGLSDAGNYAVTVTDNISGCSDNIDVDITEPINFTLGVAGNNISTCGGSDGSATLTVTGGSGDFGFAWTGPNGFNSTAQNITNLSDAGTYNVVVTDNVSGCVDNIDITITEPVNFTLGIASTDITACGASDGTVTLTITGGSGDFGFAWSGPNGFTSTAQNLTNLSDAGNYSVIVTDNVSGCSDNTNIDVIAPVNFTLGIAGNNITTCGGNDGDATLTVTGGSGDFTFAWTGPNGFTANTQNINGLSDPGNYSVQVTDNISGCNDNIAINITEPVNFTLAIAGNNISTCGGNDGSASLTITGGSGDFGILWTGPNGFNSTAQNLTNLSDPGNYNAQVTDNISGCVDNIDIDISEPVNFTLGISGTDITACGANDGTVTLTVTGGSGDFGFAWTGPNGFTSTAQNLTNLSDAGNYSVTVTDNISGCSDNIGVDITSPVNFNLVTISTNITTCGGNEGTINLSVVGGSGDFSYAWTGPGGFTASTQDLTSIDLAGNYNVVVTDNVSGCSDNLSQVISEPAGCGGANCGAFTVIVEETRPTCSNRDDGVLTFRIAGGVPNYTVILTASNGDQRAEIASGALPIVFDNLTADNFTYEIRDQGGNVCNLPYALQLESVVTATASDFVDVSCFGEATGQARITVISGGIAPYEYSIDGFVWNALPPDGVVNNLPALGTFNVLVRDDATDDCHEEVEVTINHAFPEIAMTFNTTEASCNSGGGSIEVLTVTGGEAPYSFQLDGEDFPNLPTDDTFTDLSAGFHFLSVIDNTGCTKVFDIMVDAPGLVPFTPTVTASPDCNGNGQNGTISVQVTDPTLLPGTFEAAISQDIDDPGTFELMTSGGFIEFRDLAVGNYFITVQSPGGCPNSRSISINNGPVGLGFDLDVECVDNEQTLFLSNLTAALDTPIDFEIYRVGEIDPIEVITIASLPAGNVFRIEGFNFLNAAGNFQIIMSQTQAVCPDPIKSGVTNFEIMAPLAATLGEVTQSFPERATGTIQINDIRGGNGGYEIMIEPSGGNWIEVPRNQTNQEFEFQFTELFPGDYEVFIMDEKGCEIMFQIELPQDMDVFIPNVFTPNGDSFNDTFFIRNLPIDGAKLLITNRLGRTIYSTDNYQNDWDGGTNTDGVYFYTVEINNEKYSGWVEIWRGGISK